MNDALSAEINKKRNRVVPRAGLTSNLKYTEMRQNLVSPHSSASSSKPSQRRISGATGLHSAKYNANIAHASQGTGLSPSLHARSSRQRVVVARSPAVSASSSFASRNHNHAANPDAPGASSSSKKRKKRSGSSKPYSPKFRTGGFGILVAMMYRNRTATGKVTMTQAEINIAADEYCKDDIKKIFKMMGMYI